MKKYSLSIRINHSISQKTTIINFCEKIQLNSSQSDNPPQPSLVLVNHAKSCYILGSPNTSIV